VAARIIAANPEKHGGEESGLVRWARLALAKAAPQDAECGPLFRELGKV
jgi:hypothetical protein